MENTIVIPELFDAMSIPELETFKANYQANEGVTKIIDGYIEVKQKQEEVKQIRVKYEASLNKIAKNKPAPPPDIHNEYWAWREVEVEDTTQEPELVTITNDNGEEISEERYPKVKQWQWVVELNKGFQVGKATTSQATTAKRAITVYQAKLGEPPTLIGNFRTGEEASKYLGLVADKGSANARLVRNGYMYQPYEGSDFTVNES